MQHSVELKQKEIDNLKDYIKKNSLKTAERKSEYESLRIKDAKIELILYNSGKLVYNDSEKTGRIIEGILETEREYDYTIGSDESGKGEWYGPLIVVCAALTPEEVKKFRLMEIRDSKTIPRESLMKLAEKLIKYEFLRKSIVLMPETYNRKYREFKKEKKTLNDMMAWAHSRVIKDLLSSLDYEKARVVIDKFDAKKTEFRLREIDRKRVELIQKSKAESEIPVALASIIAKYIFEREVDGLNEKIGIDLRRIKPVDLDRKLLPLVAKMHFRNVAMAQCKLTLDNNEND